ncbi:lysophosphatidic acid receptor 6-like [Pantherophis guttatus]|uniref:Lysophosphatidic acid receptor 6-like n=1 Tax=Pantherophis guttatus TaxID=94885 RepID=A0A6P9BZG4_PANGU|nr:lysophosphatidic acid receptor 6-like [Pantherophis guttatus]XP_060549249.1 lysophosphatidic acid receptor 6-like [Pantherophis guttatus]
MNSSKCHNCARVHDLVFASSYSLIFMIGLLLNSTALYIFIFRDVVRSITTVYMKNLAVCDLLLLASMPLRIYYYGWQPQLSQTTCEMGGLLLLVNMYGSIFFLTCISSDRWMAVRFPLSLWSQAIRRQAKYICVGIWTLSIGGTIPTYFAGKNTPKNSTLCFDEHPHYITNVGISSTMVLCYAITLAVMVTSSYSLLHVFHRSVSVEMELINISKIRLMVVTNVAIFLGCFLPYHLTVLCYLVPWLNETPSLDLAYKYVLLLSCVNAALDPLVYYFTTETFQRQVPLEPFLRTRASHSDYVEGIMLPSQSLEAQSPPTS